MSSDRDFRRPRTAGVASFECFSCGVMLGCDLGSRVGAVSAGEECLAIGVEECWVVSAILACPDSEAEGAMSASSSGVISL